MLPCEQCGKSDCIYMRMPTRTGLKYFVDDVEVTEAEYVAAERQAGFYNTLGHPEKPATSSFGSSKDGGIHGRTEYEPV